MKAAVLHAEDHTPGRDPCRVVHSCASATIVAVLPLTVTDVKATCISKMKGGMRRPCCLNLSACTDPELSKNGRLIEPEDDRP